MSNHTDPPELVTFSVETESADRVIRNRAGFNAFASRKELHSSEPPLVFSVVATVEEDRGVTSRYTVAEFFSSQIEGKFATDGEAAANEYAATLNNEEEA